MSIFYSIESKYEKIVSELTKLQTGLKAHIDEIESQESKIKLKIQEETQKLEDMSKLKQKASIVFSNVNKLFSE